MNAIPDSNRDGLLLSADIMWADYLDARLSANVALARGDKSLALGLAIAANKIKSRYDDVVSRYFLDNSA
jgi:hypothetical protein